MNQKKLAGRDLINIGVYTAIYFVIVMAVAMFGFIPIFIPLLTVVVPLVGGIPYMLFVSKIKKFGMLTIMGTIIGLLMFVTGMGYWIILLGIVSGLLADLVLKSGNYESSKRSVLSSAVFSIWVFGNMMPFFLNRESYFAMLLDGYGNEYVETLKGYMPMRIWPVLLIACVLFGFLGGLLGKKICRKHFERAGIV